MSDGKALIFSAPSGSGKTTIVKHLLQKNDKLAFSISVCTRPARVGEINAKDYYFLTSEEFKKKINSDSFVEWEEVYSGSYYGTLKSEVERIWDEGNVVVFDVDVKGGVALKKYFKEKALAVFIKVPTIEVLKERLEDRGTESAESLAARLQKVKYELSFEDYFDVTIVNNRLEDSFKVSEEIVSNFLKN